MIQRPKLEHLTLPSYEKVHIFRDPHKAITTRKTEKVDIGDVTYMIRENPDRISDNIDRYRKGVNPMVSVMYTNQGNLQNDNGGIPAIEAKNPYVIMKDGQFRPPLGGTFEDTRALNRQPVRYKAVLAPPVAPTEVIMNASSKYNDKTKIKAAVRPMIAYNMEYVDHPYIGNKILDPRHYSISTRVTPNAEFVSEARVMDKYIKNKPIISYLTPVFDVAVQLDGRDWNTVKLSEREKKNIALRAEANLPIEIPTQGGNSIKLKDYTWITYQANPTSQSVLVLQDQTFPLSNKANRLNRKGPAQAVTSAVTYLRDTVPGFEPSIELKRNRPIISVNSLATFSDYQPNDNLRGTKQPSKLRPSVQGGYANRGNLMSNHRDDQRIDDAINPYKKELGRYAYSMYEGRFVDEKGSW